MFHHTWFLSEGLGLISARGISAWTFHHRNFLAWGHFGTRTFWHRGTCAKMSVQKCLYCFAQCQNVHVLKHPCAEMSQCRNISVPKCPWCQNKPMLKCSHDKMYSCWKVPVMKCLCRNVSCQNVRCRNKPKTSWSNKKVTCERCMKKRSNAISYRIWPHNGQLLSWCSVCNAYFFLPYSSLFDFPFCSFFWWQTLRHHALHSR